MLDNSVIVNFATEDHRNKALADYLASCADDYIQLINVISEAAANVDETGIATIESRVNTILQQNNLNGDIQITFNEGYASLREVLSSMIIATDLYSNYEVIPNTTQPVLTAGLLQLKDFNDNVQATILSVQDIKDQITNNIQSATCAAAALYASYKDTVADRITYFKEFITNKVSQAGVLASNSFSYFKNLLLDTGINAQSMGLNVINSLGIFKRAQQDDDGIIANSDLINYTGASPVAVIDFSNVVTGVITVAKTVGTVVAGVFKGLYSLVKPVFQKVVKAVSDVVTVNDVSICNENGAPSMDGWVYQDTDSPIVQSEPTPTAWSDFVYKYSDKWIKYEFILGEVLFRVRSEQDQSQNQILDLQIKPYACNIDKVWDCFKTAGFATSKGSQHISTWTIAVGSTTSYDDLAKALSLMNDLGNELYFNEKDVITPELSYYDGFYLSASIMYWILTRALEQMKYTGYDHYLDDVTEHPFFFTPKTESVNNADFISVVSGWDKNTSNPQFHSGPLGYLFSNTGYLVTSCIAYPIIMMLCYQAYDRKYNPTNWVFLPYRNDVANFKPSKYSIKTDSENQNALNTFVNTIVAIVVALVITVTCVVLIKKHAKKMFWKRYQAVGQIDQKIWNGESLTAQEKRVYRRYQRKLSVSNFLTKDLAENTSGLRSEMADDNVVYSYQTMTDSFSQTNSNIGNLNDGLVDLTHLISG